ncbi:MAG: hypothetical protein V8Q22_02010 [Anaerostipes sp.]
MALITVDEKIYNYIFYVYVECSRIYIIVDEFCRTAKAAIWECQDKKFKDYVPTIDLQNQFAAFVVTSQQIEV